MLPTTLVTIFSFLLELSCSSPVYNMQPAYITATIGSTGRNIRNLPCISRKSNQNGVCMFAIDCLKANGTHLGTCIDRFYFGSCCHIEPVHDIIENTIDTALIPSRQPPNRVSTTTTEKITSTIETTTIPPTTIKATQTTQTPTQSTTTTSKTTSVFVTRKPPTKPPVTDENTSFKLSTFQSVDGNDVPTTLRPSPRPATTTKKTPKPTKFQNATRPRPIIKPQPNVTVIYRPTVKPVTRPRPTRPTIKISKGTTKLPLTRRNTTKPVRQTTIRDSITTTPLPITTIKLTKPTTTQTEAPVTTPVITTTKIVETTTVKPKTTPTTTATTTTVRITTTVTPVTITMAPIITTTTEKFVKLPVAQDEIPITTPKTTSSQPTESNHIPISVSVSSASEAVSGNPATNEIESEKPVQPELDATTYPTLVTWAQVNDNYTTEDASTTSSSSTEEPIGWVPLTTPDGWVLIPSLSTTTEADSSTSLPIKEATTSSDSSSSSSISSSSDSSSSTSTDYTSSSSSESSISTSSLETNDTSESTTSSLEALTSITIESSTQSSSQSTAASSTNPVNMTDFTDVCGRRMFPEARIVGGEKSSFGKWPWQISLRQWRTSTYLHKCGAALLNENWAITAAHCVDNVPPSDLLLRLGEHDLSTESEPYLHQERRVQIVASHPQFDPRTFEYDLALLRFYEPVQFQPNIIPVCVPQNDENFVGRTAYVTGWGRLYEDGPLPSILQEVSVPVINNTVCESMYRSAGYIEHIPNIFICAGWRRGGFDSCEGDSGGPMVIQRPDRRFLLAGVISWGIGCAEPNQPGVYTRISEFRDWINQILQF